MKSAFTRTAAAMFTLVAALFFLAVPSAKATPTTEPYGTYALYGSGTISGGNFTWSSGTDGSSSYLGSSPYGSGFGTGAVTYNSVSSLASISSPTQLFTIALTGGQGTLTFYITEVDSLINASAATKGTFSGLGYFTDSNFPSTDYFGTFSLTNAGIGANDQPYSVSLVIGTPEPSALVLLGTGLLAMALVAGRKFRTV